MCSWLRLALGLGLGIQARLQTRTEPRRPKLILCLTFLFLWLSGHLNLTVVALTRKRLGLRKLDSQGFKTLLEGPLALCPVKGDNKLAAIEIVLIICKNIFICKKVCQLSGTLPNKSRPTPSKKGPRCGPFLHAVGRLCLKVVPLNWQLFANKKVGFCKLKARVAQ